MGSNPELLRQSTHSLLLKQEGKDGLNDDEKPAELQYLQEKTKSIRKSSNPLDKQSMNDDEIDGDEEVNISLSDSVNVKLIKFM